MKHVRLDALGVFALACVASIASAQPGNPAASQLQPPKLVRFVPATLPAATPPVTSEIAIELALTVDKDGQVSEVSVVSGVGAPFDEAAMAAARSFEFEPARRGSDPIVARIRYRYVFEPPPPSPAAPDEAEAPPATPQAGELTGGTLDAESGDALAGAEVIVSRPDGSALRAVTDAQGRFAFRELAPGDYAVTTRLAEYVDARYTERVASSEATDVVYRLKPVPEEDEEAFGAVAFVDPPPREVTRRTIRREELTRVAGTRGDALRTVELLPGVGRPPFGSGLLLVRGSAPNDSQVLLNNTSVPLLYHFGGLTSFMNSRLLERIDFYPGNFGVRYGRKIGGILDVTSRDPATDGLHGVVDLNLIDASFLVEGPVGKEASVAFGARRSYIDFWFENVVPSEAFDVVTAPVYWDYQFLVSARPSDRDRLRVAVLGSSDTLRLIFAQPSDNDPNVRGNFNLATSFHRIQLDWDRRLSSAVDQNVVLSVGPNELNINLGQDLRLRTSVLALEGRSEWRGRLSDRVRVIGGMDLFLADARIAFTGPQPSQSEGAPADGPLGAQDTRTAETEAVAYRPAAYLETDIRPWDPLQVVMGLRLDWYREIQEWSFNPRVAGFYSITDRTRVKAGAGLFSQPPEFQESAAALGNPNLKPIQALHLSTGVDHRFLPNVSLGVEGFYKRLWDRVVSTANGAPPFFINDGTGNIYGLEVAGRVEPRGRFFGFLSYTLSRSERRDRGERTRLFDFDQTHILTLAGTYRLGRGWEIGATFRLVSGNPYTPITRGVYDVNTDLYVPVYGAINSARNPYFHRIDLRVEKKWTFRPVSLAVYLDIQNVYNATNREGVIYNFDYTRSSDLPGLPIIPSLGVRGEL